MQSCYACMCPNRSQVPPFPDAQLLKLRLPGLCQQNEASCLHPPFPFPRHHKRSLCPLQSQAGIGQSLFKGKPGSRSFYWRRQGRRGAGWCWCRAAAEAVAPFLSLCSTRWLSPGCFLPFCTRPEALPGLAGGGGAKVHRFGARRSRISRSGVCLWLDCRIWDFSRPRMLSASRRWCSMKGETCHGNEPSTRSQRCWGRSHVLSAFARTPNCF